MIDDSRSSESNRDLHEDSETAGTKNGFRLPFDLNQLLWSVFDLAVWPLLACGLAFAVVKLIVAMMDLDWSLGVRKKKSSSATRSSGWSQSSSSSSTREPLQTVDNML